MLSGSWFCLSPMLVRNFGVSSKSCLVALSLQCEFVYTVQPRSNGRTPELLSSWFLSKLSQGIKFMKILLSVFHMIRRIKRTL